MLFSSFIEEWISKAALYFACLLIIWKVTTSIISYASNNLPPGPPGIPIIGQISLTKDNLFINYKKKYGNIVYFKLFGYNVIVLNTIDLIRYAVQGKENCKIFNDRPPSILKKRFAKNGISFSSPSPEYKKLKHVGYTLLKQYDIGVNNLDTVSEELEILKSLLIKEVNRSVHLNDFIQPSILNIFGILLIGERHDYKDEYMSKAREYIKAAEILVNPYIDALLSAFPFLIYFTFTKFGKAAQNFITLDKVLLNDMYCYTKSLPHEFIESKRGLVYDLIRLQAREEWLKDTNAVGLMQDIYLPGTITTSSVLYSFFRILSNYPSVQKKIQNEIDKTIGKTRHPTVKDREYMPYTQACILELLRYSSTAPIEAHYCAKTSNLNGYTIPPNSIVLLNFFHVHTDPDLWDNPYDFNPYRFLDSSDNIVHAYDPKRRNLIPFGLGMRTCLGEIFAKKLIFIFITSLLQKFIFIPDSETPPHCDPFTLIVISSDTASYKVRFKLRNDEHI